MLYNAQMIRTWSLLLRSARRSGYVVNGRQVPHSDTLQLSMHFPRPHPLWWCSTQCAVWNRLRSLALREPGSSFAFSSALHRSVRFKSTIISVLNKVLVPNVCAAQAY